MIARRLRKLVKGQDGAAALEFALVAPLLITMVLGVFQAGIWMGTYNSMRSVANETGRWTTVEYQKGYRKTNIEIAVEAQRRATTAPYSLASDGVTTFVSDASTQSIANVTEKSLKIVYDMPNVMQFAGMGNFKISYTRPLFVKTSI
ncbi:TadE family protein [Novosphingobium sp.]|uniref:TadE family protein n=1 Tax=Novosphingobium sp. TaxID=1874826 RepID=UPI0025EC99DF|nr:TadE/TadG family type IV pilus assembly protein [Novosphingobium sp.]